VKVRALLPRLSIVVAAVVIVCALQALSSPAAILDGGFVSGEPDASLAPATNSPDNTMSSRAERRRVRRLKRLGGAQTPETDGGAPRDAGPIHIAARDAGVRLPFVAPPVLAPPVAPPLPSAAPGGPSTSLPITDLGFNTCHKIPAGKRSVKVNLKPDIELPELVAWISSITCKSFVLPGQLSAGGKKITIVTQGVMTPREAYGVFLTALDSIGLTVEQGPGYLKIIETSKAKSASLPVYGFDGRPTGGKSKRPSQTDSGN